MVSQKILLKHKSFLEKLYKTQSLEEAKLVLSQTGITALKALVSIITDVYHKKIPLCKPNEKKKLLPKQQDLSRIASLQPTLHKTKEKNVILECLIPLVDILKTILKPLFEQVTTMMSVHKKHKTSTDKNSRQTKATVGVSKATQTDNRHDDHDTDNVDNDDDDNVMRDGIGSSSSSLVPNHNTSANVMTTTDMSDLYPDLMDNIQVMPLYCSKCSVELTDANELVNLRYCEGGTQEQQQTHQLS